MRLIFSRLSIALGLACALAACGGSSGTGFAAPVPNPDGAAGGPPVPVKDPLAPGIHCAPSPATS